ncbi:hypothetical protein [uncultured Eubacterium sp.]|uniref:hypothetical protein n=1 Tax=uncultured Eubacterium sp. TaxID=165185 RepID=UPI00259AD700|nr:hypothetical protein [uncultured Eubacterium sp.]
MNYDIKFNEWQEMSLKKDVEKIVSILDKKKTLEISVLWEAFLAFLAMALDHANLVEKIPGGKVILTVVAIIPLAVMVASAIKQRRKETEEYKLFSKAKSEFVDDFDNKVCYWVMTATSFCDILSGKKVGLGEKEQDESIPFIFQEANFYVNKSIDKLDVMKPCAEVIFNKGVADSKLIDAYRLETVIYILKEVRKKSYSLEKELEENGNLSQEGIPMVAKQKECDEKYNQKMQNILGSEEIKNVLEKEISW